MQVASFKDLHDTKETEIYYMYIYIYIYTYQPPGQEAMFILYYVISSMCEHIHLQERLERGPKRNKGRKRGPCAPQLQILTSLTHTHTDMQPPSVT